MVTQEQIKAFTTAADALIEADRVKNYPNVPVSPPLEIMMGKVYARIVKKNYVGDKHGSAWCFVRLADGVIMKADGWKRPAPQNRGNILTETHGVEFVSSYGAPYLK